MLPSKIKLTLGSESSSLLLEEVEHLRHEVGPATSEIGSLLVRCLDQVERYIEQDRLTSYLAEPSPPDTPSLQEMVQFLRDSSLHTTSPRVQVSRPPSWPHPRSSPQPPALQTIQDEDYYFEKRIVKRQPLTSPLSPTSKRNSFAEHPSPFLITGLPPASPPPNKALPPIPLVPPPKSPYRANQLSTSSSAAPEIPKKSRARAFSDVTHDSKFSSVSSAATRNSVMSQSSSFSTKIPPRSSSFNHEAHLLNPEFNTVISQDSLDYHSVEVVPVQRLEFAGKGGVDGAVYAIETSPDSTILASRHDKFHVRLSDSSTGESLATIKVPFYVQMQTRSRDFFVRSHHVISETLGLVAIATGFGQTIEIWNWVKNKKVQTINDAYRWAAVRDTVFESRCYPLATYCSDDDVINLYPISDAHAKAKKKNPPFFGKPRIIELRKAGLPHIPRLPELAYSATAPLLVAAAGPRPPRPGNPPPEHAALLMAWQLDDGAKGDMRQSQKENLHAPYKYLHCCELENSLPLSLATYGSVAISIWEPAHFRTFGRPGAWQVKSVIVTERVVLVWDFGSSEEAVNGSKTTTTIYRIPSVLSCVSPDCRYVAYCDSGARTAQQQSHQLQEQYEASSRNGSLVVLDAMSGRELWRVDGPCASPSKSDPNIRNSTWSGRSSETKTSTNSSNSSSSRSNRNALLAATIETGSQGTGVVSLAASLDKVTDLAFSGDGTRLFVGYADGGVGVFEVREGIGMAA